MSTFYSAAPVVSSGPIKLWSGVQIPGAGFRYIDVDLEVYWLRMSELKLMFMHGGKCVKEGPTFNDYYGFLASVRCIEDAQSMAARYSVDAMSSAEVTATLTVFDRPAVKDLRRDSVEHNRRADADPMLKRVWSYLDDGLREKFIEEGETRYKTLESRPVAERVVWTSKSPAVDIDALVASLREEFMPREVVTC